MKLSRDTWVLPAVAALVLLLDRVSKHMVATRLAVGQSWDVAPWLTPILRITHVTNTGAAFGLFPNWGGFFVIIGVVVITAILFYQQHVSTGQWLVRAALGLQLGGACGNLFDRLTQGAVVDFIDLNFWPLRQWPVSNIADVSIVTGTCLLVFLMWWAERRESDQQAIVDSSR